MSKKRRLPLSPVLIAFLLVSLSLAQTDAAEEEKSGWLESLLYNPAERSVEGATALKAAAPEAAAEALDTALRLDPASEAARYNAGTANLFAGTDKAAPLLEAAANSSDKQLAARAYYNLGNSRLKGEDLQAAVEAYKESLRRDPTSADAKFNLELALRRLQEQQKQQDQQKDQQKQDQQKDQQQDQQNKEGGQGQNDQDQQKKEEQQKQDKEGQDPKQDSGEQQKQDQGQGEDQKKEDGKQGEQKDPQQAQPGRQGESSPLPQFHDLPDMDAQQAAAILEAIENLERNQRRQDAKKALKANASGKKDW